MNQTVRQHKRATRGGQARARVPFRATPAGRTPPLAASLPSRRPRRCTVCVRLPQHASVRPEYSPMSRRPGLAPEHRALAAPRRAVQRGQEDGGLGPAGVLRRDVGLGLPQMQAHMDQGTRGSRHAWIKARMDQGRRVGERERRRTGGPAGRAALHTHLTYHDDAADSQRFLEAVEGDPVHLAAVGPKARGRGKVCAAAPRAGPPAATVQSAWPA